MHSSHLPPPACTSLALLTTATACAVCLTGETLPGSKTEAPSPQQEPSSVFTGLVVVAAGLIGRGYRDRAVSKYKQMSK
jgi:hypothetical protein